MFVIFCNNKNPLMLLSSVNDITFRIFMAGILMSLLLGLLVQVDFSCSLMTQQDHVTPVAIKTASLATTSLYCDYSVSFQFPRIPLGREVCTWTEWTRVKSAFNAKPKYALMLFLLEKSANICISFNSCKTWIGMYIRKTFSFSLISLFYIFKMLITCLLVGFHFQLSQKSPRLFGPQHLGKTFFFLINCILNHDYK